MRHLWFDMLCNNIIPAASVLCSCNFCLKSRNGRYVKLHLYMVYTTGEFYQAKMEIRERHPQENALVCFKIAHIIELTKQ